MTISQLRDNAVNRLQNNHSQSSVVQFVFQNANNDTQAKMILKNLF